MLYGLDQESFQGISCSCVFVFLLQRKLIWLLWLFYSLIQPFWFWGLCFWFWEVFPLRCTSIIKCHLGVFMTWLDELFLLFDFRKHPVIIYHRCFYGQPSSFSSFFSCFYKLNLCVWPGLMFLIVCSTLHQDPFWTHVVHSQKKLPNSNFTNKKKKKLKLYNKSKEQKKRSPVINCNVY